MDVPFKPNRDQTPTFNTARATCKRVMNRLGLSSYLCWVMYADDSIGLHKFNANGSHRKVVI